MTTSLPAPAGPEVERVGDSPLHAGREVRGAPGDRPIFAIGALLVLVVAVRYWLSMLSRDLRFDENLTGWVVSGSFTEAIERSWIHQGQSPLYFGFIWAWQQVAGSGELSLRLPSLVALGVAVWQLHRLGTALDGRRTGLLAALFLVGLQTGATDARPYPFLVLALIVATRAGLAWLDQGQIRYGFGWVAASAFAFAMHPLAAYALLAQLIFPVLRRRRGGPLGELVAVGSVGMILVAPVVPQVLMLQARQETLVLVDAPSVLDLAIALVPFQLLAAATAALLISRSAVPRVDAPRWPHAWFLAIPWTVLPAIGLFVQSHVTGSSVFVERYWLGAAPGAALVVAMFVSRQCRTRVSLAIALGAFAIASAIALAPVDSRDWYSAAAAIDAADAEAAIWTVTGYVESRNPEAFTDSSSNDYLNAPLLWHGAARPLESIPSNDDARSRSIIDERVRLARARGRPVVLVESREGAIRTEGAEYAETALLSAGYERAKIDSALGVLMTTFVPPTSS